ncbi:MAG: TonB-dependent receptor [Limibacillus sp.]
MTTPAMLSLGATYDIDENWSVSAEAQYTFWSSFDELRVASNGSPISVTQENWDDQIFLALGGEYRMDDKWTFRAGVAYDETPINDTFRTPRIPGGSRYWLAVGASYEVNEWFGIDAGYTHIFVEDTEVRLNGSESVPSPGPLTADYENGIDILSIQARFSF